jgi:hypothetical protein
VGLGVSLDVEAFGRERLELVPGERILPRAHIVGVDEERGGIAQLLEHGIGELLERAIAVVKRQHHRLPGQLPLEGHELDELLEADDVIPLALQVPHLLLERGGRQHQPALGLPVEVVIAEDGHELIAVRFHSGRIPGPHRTITSSPAAKVSLPM